MKMSKSLASCLSIKVAQLKVMCGIAVDTEAVEDKTTNSVTSDPIASTKFLSVFKQRLKSKQLAVEFKAISKSCEDHAANAALRNVLLNIKQDVVTYDHSRVIVWDIPLSVGTDYYNASFVDGYNGPKEYIAAQGPSSKCLASFWHLVWQEGVTCVVMATGLFENAMQQCDKYWVDHTRKYSRHGDIHIWHERSVYLAKLNIRTFRIQKSGSCESRQLTHFEMVGLHEESPDPGLVLEVRRRVNALAVTQPGPVLVHCRCGGGRTAVYISVDFCLHQLQAEDRVDVFNTVLHLRRFRRGMVRSLGQYTQIYRAVAMYLQCGVTVHPSLTLPAAVHVHYRPGGDNKHLKLEREFQTLQSIVPCLSIGDCASGHRVENRSKSRDIMMLPPECARPYLTTADCGDSGTDFINAVYVDGYHFENAYLVTQWPMKRTTADLWRLMFDFKITSLILMHDMRKFSRKYPRFWPKNVDQVVAYGPISVRYLYCERKSNLIVRTFAIRKPKRHPHLIANALMSISDDVMVLNTLVGCETRVDEIVVKLFQVLGEPSGSDSNSSDSRSSSSRGRPRADSSHRLHKKLSRAGRDRDRGRPACSDSEDLELDLVRSRRVRGQGGRGSKEGRSLAQWAESLLMCMEQVSDWQRRTGSRQPVCVVSKDGSIRVGAYCAIAVCCDQARVEREVDVFNAVRLVRKNRPQLVPNIEEYQFIYRFMADYIAQSNQRPEIVISEPEVTPECFSPLSPISPVVRAQFGGINVAASGKIFTPTSVRTDGERSGSKATLHRMPNANSYGLSTQRACYLSGYPQNGTILPQGQQTFHKLESHNKGYNAEVQCQCSRSQGRFDKAHVRDCEHEKVNVPGCESYKLSDRHIVENLDHWTRPNNHTSETSRTYCTHRQFASLPENKGTGRDALIESSSRADQCVADRSSLFCNYSNDSTCEESCQNENNPVNNAFLISQSPLEQCDSHQRMSQSSVTCQQHCQCHARHNRHSISLSQSYLTPEMNTPLPDSPWFSRTRSKPNSPQRKVSWPPPASLSPGQYISPHQDPPPTCVPLTSELNHRFAPPPVPPPTPHLRHSQLSTFTSATSFYSCRSQLSITAANPNGNSNFPTSESCHAQHPCCSCTGDNLFISLNSNVNGSHTPSPNNKTLQNCDSYHPELSAHANMNGQPRFLSPSSAPNHLSVPTDGRQVAKASNTQMGSLSLQNSLGYGDTNCIKNSSNSSSRQTRASDHHHALRQQTMRVCVPTGGDPTDFKLIHASYASLDESLSSSIDSHNSSWLGANGDLWERRPHRHSNNNNINNNNSSNNNNNNNHSINNHVPGTPHHEPDGNVQPLSIRRLSKTFAVNNALGCHEEERNSKTDFLLDINSTARHGSLWKRAKSFALRKKS